MSPSFMGRRLEWNPWAPTAAPNSPEQRPPRLPTGPGYLQATTDKQMSRPVRQSGALLTKEMEANTRAQWGETAFLVRWGEITGSGDSYTHG
jgi:hypothetical protein